MANTFDFVPFTGGFTIKLGTDDGIDYPAGFWKVETPSASTLEIRNVNNNALLHTLIVGTDTIKFSGVVNAGNAAAIKTALQTVFFKANTGTGGSGVTSYNDLANKPTLDSFEDTATKATVSPAQKTAIGTNTSAISNEVTNRTAADTTLQNQITTNGNNIATNTSNLNRLKFLAIQKRFGIIIPAFKTANKFDNLGASLSSPQLAIHASGTGLISGTAATNADGYIKLPHEVTGRTITRTDWLLSWDTTESGASMTVGIGDSTGYLITVANSGGNVVITWPSGATVTSALTGTVNICFSIVTGNMYITCSAQIIGLPTLATSVPLRVPVYEVVSLTKTKLFHAYFKTNTTTSKIAGFLHNINNWDGDPTGQLLTASVACNVAGYVGEHQNIIIIPARINYTTPLKVVHFFHQRAAQATSIIDIAIGDNGETARRLIDAGYSIIGTSGGIYNGAAAAGGTETDWWGNPRGTSQANEVYETLAAYVTNVGKENLVGYSMGGMSAANYLRNNPTRVAAVWLTCPVLDAEETGSALAVQTQAALKASIDAAYCSWYLTLTTTVVDPQTDSGTNYRQVSGPGQNPAPGVRNYTLATVSSTVTNSNTVPTSAGTRFYPNDVVYFKWSGQTRTVLYMQTGTVNSIILDAPVTLAASETISIIRHDGRRGHDYYWHLDRPLTEWSSGNRGINAFVKRKSAHPEFDVRPYNPLRFADIYAELGIPFHIMVGGDATSTGNDGILNNAPMFAFRDAVNAITPGLVTMVSGSGSHLGNTTLSWSDLLTLFNSIP